MSKREIIQGGDEITKVLEHRVRGADPLCSLHSRSRDRHGNLRPTQAIHLLLSDIASQQASQLAESVWPCCLTSLFGTRSDFLALSMALQSPFLSSLARPLIFGLCPANEGGPCSPEPCRVLATGFFTRHDAGQFRHGF